MKVYLIDLGMAAKVRPMLVISRRDEDAPRALSVCASITTSCRGSDYEIPIGKPAFLRENSWVNVQGIQANRAGIPKLDSEGRKVDFHCLRVTFASLLNLQGVTPRSAMELMRHSDMRLTHEIYTDVTVLPLAFDVQKLPSL